MRCRRRPPSPLAGEPPSLAESAPPRDSVATKVAMHLILAGLYVHLNDGMTPLPLVMWSTASASWAARVEVRADLAVPAGRLLQHVARRAREVRRERAFGVPAAAAPGAFEPYQVRPSSSTAMAPAKATAIGRRDTRRSGRRSMNGMPIRTTMQSVGMMIVANSSSSGFLKIAAARTGRRSTTPAAGRTLDRRVGAVLVERAQDAARPPWSMSTPCVAVKYQRMSGR